MGVAVPPIAENYVAEGSPEYNKEREIKEHEARDEKLRNLARTRQKMSQAVSCLCLPIGIPLCISECICCCACRFVIANCQDDSSSCQKTAYRCHEHTKEAVFGGGPPKNKLEMVNHAILPHPALSRLCYGKDGSATPGNYLLPHEWKVLRSQKMI